MPRPKKSCYQSPRMSRPEDLIKRSYYTRECIADAFKQVNHGDVLLPTNGMMVMWIALMEYPAIRDAAVNEACEVDVTGLKDIEARDKAVIAAAQKLKKVFEDEVWQQKLNRLYNSLSRKEQYDLAVESEKLDASEPAPRKAKSRKR